MKLLKQNLLTMALLCLVIISCSKDDSAQNPTVEYNIDLNLVEKNNSEMSSQILTLINDHRVSLGLNILKMDTQYSSAFAVDHTLYMIDVEGLNHDNFGYRSEGIKYHNGAKEVSEIVAYGQETAESVVHAWLSSPSHKVIIEGNFTHAGFGIIKSAKDRNYFTQIFYNK